jgi:O-antigen/teichoic acid export membrane protein
MKLFQTISIFFTTGHKRNILVRKNIAALFIIKGLSIAIGLIMVPLTINYLDATKYGIWITLSSIITWFSFFDIGLGNGLRNRFAEAMASGKHELAKIYVSTAYAILSLIIGIVLLLFYIINPFLNWNKILNVGQDIIFKNELSLLALVVFTFFCLRFVFKLITTLLTADQRPAMASFFDLLGKVVTLVLIFILTKTTTESLLYLGIVISSLPAMVLIISSVWLFKGRYKIYRPSIKLVDFSKAKDLLNLGLKFFIIQISALLLYSTNNIIITQLFGPEMVTTYNVAFKYFSILMMGFTIVITPFWSAFTEAWIKKEIAWIKNIMDKLIMFWGLLVILGLIMLYCSSWVYLVWIGDKVSIPNSISALVLIWVLLNAWNGIFSHFLNGVGKIKLQLYLGISVAIFNIPLSVFLGKLFGISGILLANVTLSIIQAVVYPFQYRKLITNSALII